MSVKTPSSTQGADTEELWTRAEVAKYLGLTVSGLRNQQKRGLFHPKRDARGVWLFDPAEVRKAALRAGAVKRGRPGRCPPGALAALAFRRFAAGVTLSDLVIELEQPPEVLRELHRQWSMDWTAGEVDCARRLRAQREALASREVIQINKSYDAMAQRQVEESKGAIAMNEEIAANQAKLNKLLERL